MNTKILLVDDDTELCALLAEYLRGEQFLAECAHSGEAALAKLAETDGFAALVLDIMMPGLSGLDVLVEIRKTSDVPVLMLTGRGDDIDRIIGLEMGADDYMAKPCNPRELLARLRAILRRTQGHNHHNQQLDLHEIVLHSGTRLVHARAQELKLTSAEFNTLQALMQHAGHTLSKQQLTEVALNRPLEAHDRSIDVHLSRIRRKLAQAGVHEVIKAVRGVGYQMISEEKK